MSDETRMRKTLWLAAAAVVWVVGLSVLFIILSLILHGSVRWS